MQFKMILSVALLFGSVPAVFPVSPISLAQAESQAERMERMNSHLTTMKYNKRPMDRAKAARELGLMRAIEALPQLHKTLIADTSTDVRIHAANAIALINQKDSAKLLLASLNKCRGKSDAQLAIIRALGDMGDNAKDTVPAMVKLLRSPSPFMREAVVEALWRIRDERVSKILNKLLTKESELIVRITLVKRLPDFKDPNTIPILKKITKNPDEHVDVIDLADEGLIKLETMGVEAPLSKED